jgi:hypothetical protein
VEQIALRFKIVEKAAFLLKRHPRRRTVFIHEPLVGAHVNVELIVYVYVRAAHVGHVKAEYIVRVIQHIYTSGPPADFLVDKVVAEGKGASQAARSAL